MIEGVEHLATLKARCSSTRLVAVCDREADLYDPFLTERPAGVGTGWCGRPGIAGVLIPNGIVGGARDSAFAGAGRDLAIRN